MPKLLNRLTSFGLRPLPAGKHLDGAGLYLIKSEADSGRWMLRYRQFGRRRDMGLGGWPAVSLAEARRKSEAARQQLRNGEDPITTRQAKRRTHFFLLRDIAKDCFETRKSDLRADGVAGRWFSPLELHVLPKLGGTPITQINQVAIKDALASLWREKPVTAAKALERLGIIFKHAAAMGLDVDLQATAKARLLLGKPRHQVQHIPAMPWAEVPAFYASLNEQVPAHLALRLLILTGVRSGPMRHIRLGQIDKDTGIWTVPAEVMKGRVGATSEFRVPLAPQAMRIVEEAASVYGENGFLFPGANDGPISDMTLSMHMKRQGLQARPHGFRTSLRVWLAEQTSAPHEVAETVLAHTVGNKVERAYRRTDYLEQRRMLMQQWADHVSHGSTPLHQGSCVRHATSER
jgi:integrase